MLKWLWLSVGIILLDQLSKMIVRYYIAPYEVIEVLPFFNLIFVENSGAAFSFLSDAGGWQRWLFVGLALGLSLVLGFWLKNLPTEARLQAIAMASIIGGGLGNLIDRLGREGRVTDFLDFYVGDCRYCHWPAFNVADSAITIGVCLLLYLAWRGQMR